ncbi:hypothetical protein STCU_00522 [Strigomonas culicis]|uniref:Uncharacterized protein n=1 Tax=Strigomonas culicis TaxID=28005 RepID=S9WBR8_9TRYP|nr:hypothetical protein STCU_05272 [Strigomonas culicis]EPY36556.1 hypothetical protein STCU_00522 [Strigomonas culicis]|eukprot:EPY28158.1 hypothetical protein STCU_05272 [Strigomonas culicis]
MADAARSVKHYVSDCLEERHPYDIKKGFGGRNERDAGKVFDGFSTEGIEDNLSNLTDSSISDTEKAKATHFLYSHSASEEKKIFLLEKGCVSIIVSVLRNTQDALLENQCFLLLRSLCVIPHGCYPVVRSGGLERALHALTDESQKESRDAARTSAAHLVYQISVNPSGVRWMLQIDDGDQFKLKTAVDAPASVEVTPADILRTVTLVLQTEARGGKMVAYAAGAFSNMVALQPGLEAVLCEPDDVLAVVDRYLSQVTAPALFDELVASLLTALWNIAMDQRGVECLEKFQIPSRLCDLFLLVSANVEAIPLSAQRVTMGALSACHKLTSIKDSSVEAVGVEGKPRVLLLIEYLRTINRKEEAAKANGREPSNDVVAILKNTNQCIRFSSEVRGTRTLVHAYIDAMEDRKEAFYFRRQLYFSTKWEEEFDASV